MLIDEEKTETPYHLKGEEEIFTDHTALICQLNASLSGEKKEKNERVMTKESYRRFAIEIQRSKPSRILRGTGDMQVKYKKWSEKVLATRERCMMKIGKKRNKSKAIRLLMRAKRKLRKSGKQTEMEKTRMAQIKNHIQREQSQRYASKIVKTIEQLRKNGGGMQEESFWEFRRKISPRKEEKATQMEDKEG